MSIKILLIQYTRKLQMHVHVFSKIPKSLTFLSVYMVSCFTLHVSDRAFNDIWNNFRGLSQLVLAFGYTGTYLNHVK